MKYTLVHPSNSKYGGIYGGLQFKDGKAVFDTDYMSYLDKNAGATPEEVLAKFKGQGFEIQPEKVAQPVEAFVKAPVQVPVKAPVEAFVQKAPVETFVQKAPVKKALAKVPAKK